MPLLERKPIIDYLIKKKEKIKSLSYEICDKIKKEEIIERKVFIIVGLVIMILNVIKKKLGWFFVYFHLKIME